MNKTAVFVFSSLNIVRGGMTRAVLYRANTLVKNNHKVVILTLDFQPRFESIINELYELGSLDKRVEVISFFNDVLGTRGKISGNSEDEIDESEFYIFKDEKQSNPTYRYYKDGLYVKYKRYDKSGNLLFIDYMNESRQRYQRDEFNTNGEVIRSRQMSLVDNQPRLDRYYDSSGDCAITVWVDENGNGKRTLLFNKENPKEYSKLEDFQKRWIEEKLTEFSSPVVYSDARKLDNIVAKINNKQVKKIAVLHNNQLKPPYDNIAEINNSWHPFFNNINEFDRIVFLTKEQKNDIEHQVGKLETAILIPHAVPEIEKQKTKDKVEKNPNLVVTVARYKKQKRLDEAIKAFSYVVKEVPEAQYHIYGFGDLQKDLESLIKKLKLTNNVKLLGFISDPIKIYQSAACSILTSDCEGFGLVLTESLAAGTPVVSYDLKYGPKDIIKEGIDGYLVPKGDKQEMAKKIITILKNKKLREKLSDNTSQVFNRFGIDKYEENWLNLMNTI